MKHTRVLPKSIWIMYIYISNLLPTDQYCWMSNENVLSANQHGNYQANKFLQARAKKTGIHERIQIANLFLINSIQIKTKY